MHAESAGQIGCNSKGNTSCTEALLCWSCSTRYVLIRIVLELDDGTVGFDIMLMFNFFFCYDAQVDFFMEFVALLLGLISHKYV